MRKDLAKRDFDMYSAGLRIDHQSYDPYQIWHTSSDNPNGSNRFGFGNAKSDEIIENIRTTSDDTERYKLMMQLEEIIYDEQPLIVFYNSKSAIVASKRLKEINTSLHSPGYFENFFQLK